MEEDHRYGSEKMKKDFQDIETDVFFLLDSGFTCDQIASIKKLDIEHVNEIINGRRQKVRTKKKKNLIQEVANKNPWKDKPPRPGEARSIGQTTWKPEELETDHYHDGRTITNKTIDETDRSDRIGEDVELTARLNAQAKLQHVEGELRKLLEDEAVVQALKEKKDWEDVVDDVLKLLNSDG